MNDLSYNLSTYWTDTAELELEQGKSNGRSSPTGDTPRPGCQNVKVIGPHFYSVSARTACHSYYSLYSTVMCVQYVEVTKKRQIIQRILLKVVIILLL